MTIQEQPLEEIETELHVDDRQAEMFTIYSPSSTNKAIVDAKRAYAERHSMDTDDVVGRKWERGWDGEKNTVYVTVACSVERGYD